MYFGKKIMLNVTESYFLSRKYDVGTIKSIEHLDIYDLCESSWNNPAKPLKGSGKHFCGRMS